MTEEQNPKGQAADESAPKIEFPCQYPIKVMGLAAPDYKQFISDIVETHAPQFDRSLTRLKQSRNGKYYSVTLFITATSVEQLQAIFDDLKASGRVEMVL